MLLRRLVNKSGRTLQAFLPWLASPDDDFARNCLRGPEYGLYLRMDPRDRVHCVLVARQLQRQVPGAGRELIAAALLHDVAKSLLPFNAVQRILVHLYRPKGLPAWPLRSGLTGALQLREHHELLAAGMLRSAGVSEQVTRLIEDLAITSAAQPEAVRQLRRADRLT